MKNKWEAVRLCKPFNDSPYILTKGRQGCAFRIKMGHLFHEKGLAKARLPGRFEIIEKLPGYQGLPAVILDGAHTLNSVKLTIDTFNKLYGEKKVNLLFACAADKDVEDIAKIFKYRFEHIYITRPGEKKESNLEKEIQAFKDAELQFTADPDFKKMIKTAFEDSAQNASLLLITGSFYLIAEAKSFIDKLSE